MTGKPAVLVDEASATVVGLHWDSAAHHVQAINRTHSDLVKFSYHDDDYERVLGILERFAYAAIKEVETHSRERSQR